MINKRTYLRLNEFGLDFPVKYNFFYLIFFDEWFSLTNWTVYEVPYETKM